MDYFRIMTGGDLNNQDLCLVEGYPDGMGLKGARLALGAPAARYFPDDATFKLKPENPGLKLSGLLGNLDNNLMLNSAGVDAVRELMKGEDVEFLHFILLDHKGRVHSDDYWIINPLGTRDCLHYGESNIKRNDEGDVLLIKKFVLDKQKLGGAPALFRIQEDPTEYVMSEELIKALGAADVKNVLGYKLVQA